MLLRTERLTKDYGPCRALDRLDLEIAAGEIFGLLGPNGSGKSTALRLMLGFLQPTSGHAWIAGHECWHDSVNARQKVAYLPGELRLYENMTGRQLVRFLSQLRRRPDPEAIHRLAATFDIDISRPIAKLSSGMKRKVALLQVLLPQTPLLILDEPTNTLDPTMRDQLLEQLIEARQRGQAVLFSSHVLAEVEKVCDRVGILHKGRLVHLQKMTELHEVRRIRATFPGPAAQPPELPGLKVLAPRPASPARQGGEPELSDARRSQENTLTLEYAGPLPPLLAWLAEQRVIGLQIEPQGLAPIYHHYHGTEA